MTCLSCGAWAPADASTGYDADVICPQCSREGWELTTDGQLLHPDDDRSDVSIPARAAAIARVPRRMVRARPRRRSRGASIG